MGLIEQIIEKAQSCKQRIGLPEGDEPRTLQAADRIIADNIADVILIGPAQKIADMAAEYSLKNIDKARVIDPKANPDKQRYGAG